MHVGFEDLPDELILSILSHLETSDIIRCSQLSRRIRAISQDEFLWQRVYLCNKTVHGDFVEMALNKGCKYLSLRGVELTGHLSLNMNSQLKHLELIDCNISEEVIDGLIKSCQSLETISISYEKTYDPKLSFCKKVIQLICSTCVGLREATFSYLIQDEDDIEFFVDHLPTTLEKLTIRTTVLHAYRTYMFMIDDEIQGLVARCKKLKSVELNGRERL